MAQKIEKNTLKRIGNTGVLNSDKEEGVENYHDYNQHKIRTREQWKNERRIEKNG